MIPRRRDADGDGGFALVFVLLLTAALMALVATTLSVTTPNIVNAKSDQDADAAYLAAQSGVEDFVAYLSSISACRSTTKICTQALGSNSTSLNRSQLGNGQSFTWTSDSTLTPEQYVRVRVSGKAGGATKKLVADISLAPSILSFGYYTDYESQSPGFLEARYSPRVIDLTDSDTYGKINARNTSGQTVSVSNSTTVGWNGPPPDSSTSTNPYPAGICGQHWYYDSASSPGRSQDGTNAVWGETGTIVTSRTNTMIRTAGCDVVFTSGMELDGPIYTRDALYVSDGTTGGVGPIFDAPVYSLWGFGKYNNPLPASATPWRKDSQVGGNVSSQSPYRPQIAGLDLQLPTDIGTDGLPTDYCVYTGPTRVVLNANGTATVTSPETTAKNSSSDPSCYPTTLDGNGIVRFTLNYATVGSGTIYVQKAGSTPSDGWPENPTKSTNTAGPTNEVMYLTAAGGAANPNTPSTSAALSSGCTSTKKYSAVASSTCAWTNVATTTDATSTTGWTAYGSGTACSSGGLVATDRQLFECEYAQKTSGSPPGTAFTTVRTNIQNYVAARTCSTGDLTDERTCLLTYVNGQLRTANTGGAAYSSNTTCNTNNARQYYATGTQGSQSVTTANLGSAPTAPMSTDPIFTSTSSTAVQTRTKTPITFTVYRQTCSSNRWGTGVPQFTFTVTEDVYTFAPAQAVSYFPNEDDVTAYNTGADSNGNAVGSTGANQPGDLYVEGTNAGKLSMIAENDVVVTDDITNPADSTGKDVYNPLTDAVDIVAGGNVRNYNPVECADQDAGDINATSAGWCPNDITGLYNSVLESNGTLNAAHPAMQYTNRNGTGARRIDAALFALSGSFMTDNYNRGLALGKLTVNGGIYQSHRGANGVQWEYTGSGARPSSGYSLQYHYIDLEHANLPYAPPATGGSTTRVWNVVSVSAG